MGSAAVHRLRDAAPSQKLLVEGCEDKHLGSSVLLFGDGSTCLKRNTRPVDSFGGRF